ncbi:MAG: stage II sporulation protein E [Peptostreptococcaceae bacterium]
MERSLVASKSNISLKNIIKAGLIDSNTIILCSIGFLLSRAMVVDDIAPLGVAFFLCASIIDKYKFPVFIATMAGTLLSFNQTSNIIKYAICIMIIQLISNKFKNVKSITKISMIGMVIIVPLSIGQALIFGNYIYNISIALVECIVMFVSTYIFSYGVSVINKRASRKVTSSEEIVALTIIITFSIIGIGNINILGISIRNILATMTILILSITGGAALGSASGVIIGLVYFVNNLTTSMYMGIYAFAGLIAGGFNKVNKYLSIAGYILGWSLIYIYTSGSGSNMMEIRDILIASILVILIPDNFIQQIEKFIKGTSGVDDGAEDYLERSREITNNRLRGMYKTYADLANTFDRIREKEKILDQKDIAHIIDMVHHDECKKCGMKRRCWENKFNYTYTMMNRILEELEDTGEVYLDNIPNDFKKDCIKPENIVKTANYYYKMFALDYSWQQKFSENRKLVAKQIRYMSKSIECMAMELDRDITFDIEMEKNILVELDRNNISIDRLNYISKDKDEFEILMERETCKDNHLCEKKIVGIISNIVGQDLVASKVGCNRLGEKCKVKLSKRQEYKVVTEVSNMSKDGYVISGDNYTYMEISEGKYMVAISDGMGKGRKAYEESSVTIDILEKMMDSKIDEEIVIDTINNILMLKSSDEMFSTLDLGIIDLNKGVLNTIKMGACSTYIKRSSGEIELISTESLPVGILSDVNIERDSSKLKDGDYIIMVSDGIIDAGKNKNLGDNWLIYFLKSLDTINPKDISKEILNRALDIQNNNIYDDMTVLVTKVYKC